MSLRTEARAALELWLLPALLAVLPYRVGIALARLASRTFPLYDDAAKAAAAQWGAVVPGGDARAFVADYRYAQLVDHVDLFWSLTRSRAFLARRTPLRLPPLPRGRPLLVVSFHYGQGLWLMHALAAQGIPARFVSIRLRREDAAGPVSFAYARLRVRRVESLAGVAPIFTGGARRDIAQTLAAGTAVYGLVDVPVPGAGASPANATLLGHPVLLPAGLLESSRDAGAQALVVTARVAPDGERVVEVDEAGPVDALTLGWLADLLERRLREAPAAWHFWHLWPSFLAQRR